MSLWIFFKDFLIFIKNKTLDQDCYDLFNKEVSVTADLPSGKLFTYFFYQH